MGLSCLRALLLFQLEPLSVYSVYQTVTVLLMRAKIEFCFIWIHDKCLLN